MESKIKSTSIASRYKQTQALKTSKHISMAGIAIKHTAWQAKHTSMVTTQIFIVEKVNKHGSQNSSKHTSIVANIKVKANKHKHGKQANIKSTAKNT